METNNPYLLLPGITPQELTIVKQSTAGLSDAQNQTFYNFYVSKRKNPQEILLFALPGLIGFAGIHRFVTGQITWGVLYLFTAGLFFIGTIMDLINYRRIANDYNQKMAYESFHLTKLGVNI